jgi:hypothetical protein
MSLTTRIKIARAVAIGADFLQIALFPLFAEGFISPLDDALDVGVCGLLTYLVGWHFSFLPSFVVKVIPLADMVPTWTIAVFLATRKKNDPVIEVEATPVYENVPPRIQAKMPTDK